MGAASGVGAAEARATGLATGSGTATAIGASEARSTGTAAGTSTAEAVGDGGLPLTVAALNVARPRPVARAVVLESLIRAAVLPTLTRVALAEEDEDMVQLANMHPDDIDTRAVDFTKALDAAPTAGGFGAIAPSGSLVLDGVATLTGYQVIGKFKNGVDGTTYSFDCYVDLPTGRKVYRRCTIHVTTEA